LLGDKSHEIITLNKATRPQEVVYGSSKKKNQYDVRASGDLVIMEESFSNRKRHNHNNRRRPIKTAFYGCIR
jgi:hypothetical protein